MTDRPLTVAFVGNFQPTYSTENDVREAFEVVGHRVLPIQENGGAGAVRHLARAAAEADLLLWTGTWQTDRGDHYHPKAIPLGDALDAYKVLADRRVPSACYHLDLFWGTGRSGRAWWRHPMFRARQVFTADGDHDRAWEALGIDHTWLPPAVRYSAAKRVAPGNTPPVDVAFVGADGPGYHPDVWPYRRQLVDTLEAMCARRGWSFRNPGGRHPKVDRSDDLNRFYAAAKVTVGDSLCLAGDRSRYWSDRVYEATGRGGLLIMPRLDNLAAQHPDLPMYPWHDFDALEHLIAFYLSDAVERERTVDACQARTAELHTYVNRAQTIIDLTGAGA